MRQTGVVLVQHTVPLGSTSTVAEDSIVIVVNVIPSPRAPVDRD